MRVFTYSEARQNLVKLLTLPQSEPVRIRRRDGSMFTLDAVPTQKSITVRRIRRENQSLDGRYFPGGERVARFDTQSR